MRQAFCGVLQQELRDYYRLMAILEAQSQQAPPCAASGAPSAPFIRALFLRVKCRNVRPVSRGMPGREPGRPPSVWPPGPGLAVLRVIVFIELCS